MMPRGSVLVVEGDPAVLRLLAEVLGERYSVGLADCTETALARLSASLPDLLMTDCVLLGGGLHALLGRAEAADVPILLTSGHPEMIARYAAGPYPFLAKPFKLTDLLELVGVTIGMGRIANSEAPLARASALGRSIHGPAYC